MNDFAQRPIHANALSVQFRQRPLALALAAALSLSPLVTHAATIQVTSSSNAVTDGALCTLRGAGYAIDAGANGSNCVATGTYGVNDTITFAASVTLINLDSYGSAIYVGSNSRTIQGTGVGGVTIQRTVAAANTFPIINFNGCGTLTLNGMTIEGGNNTSTNNGNGGGISPNCYGGNIVISNSIIRNNTASQSGGGLSAYGGNITITNSTVSGNFSVTRGGGVNKDYGGDITITSSTISGNSSGGRGGGVHHDYGGSVSIANSAITGNSSKDIGGGVHSDGTLFAVSNSTFSGNTASSTGGGAFLTAYAAGTTSYVENSTFSGNSTSAKSPASGLYIENYGTATVDVRNSTITSNTGGTEGARLACYGGNITLNSTIMWGNSTADLRTTSCAAGEVSGSNNLVGVFGTGDFTAITGTLSSDPLLGPLANNGGATQTHALLAGSPAINTGSNPGGLSTDQRGGGFPRSAGLGTDIGAFEVSAVLAPQVVPVGSIGVLLANLLGLLATGLAVLRRRRR